MDYSRIEDGLVALGYKANQNNMAEAADREALAKFFEDFNNVLGTGTPTKKDILDGKVSWAEIESALEVVIVARTRFAIEQNPPSNQFEILRHQQRLQWLGFFDEMPKGIAGPRTEAGNELFRKQYMEVTATTVTPLPPAKEPARTLPPAAADGFTVYLDPGHGFWHRGWYDGGAEATYRGKTVYEADVVLTQALAIAQELQDRGVRVILIRDDEDNIGKAPNQRIDIADDGVNQIHGSQSDGLSYRSREAVKDMQRSGGKGLYISLHADAADNPEASRISIRHARGAAKGSEFATLLADEFNTDGVTQAANGGDDAIVRANNYQVLRETRDGGLPAVLVELGFMSNKEDLGRLMSPWQQQHTADQFADAIEKYIGR